MTLLSPRLRKVLNTQIQITRKDLLTWLGGFVLGAPAGAAARYAFHEYDPEGGRKSYSQGGEDIAADFLFQNIGVGPVTYLDVGAHDPVKINNTYFFYRKGDRGVLVEPNGALCEKLRQVRPRDTVLEVGIGPSAAREADYYLMTDSSWSTFSKEEAEHEEKVTGGKIRIKKVIKIPLLNINDVMKEHFGGPPSFLSIDTEGLDLAILKSMDFARFRPPLICAETMVCGSKKLIPETAEYMATVGYAVRGGSLVNTLFVDTKVL
jgi:FkbM family methyltransferase